jgi:hypothetical protein
MAVLPKKWSWCVQGATCPGGYVCPGATCVPGQRIQVVRRIRLWKLTRSRLRHFEFASFADLYAAIASGRLCKPPPVR